MQKMTEMEEMVSIRMDDSQSTSSTLSQIQQHGNISCLFPEILSLIFRYLDVRSKGRAARVSTVWKEAAYRHHVWRGVEARLHLRKPKHFLLQSLVQRGIRRVQVLSLRRGIRDIIIGLPEMSSLNLSGCYNVTDAAMSSALTHDLPCLTALNVSLCKQITDITLGRIATYLTNLEELDIGGCCNITSHGVLLIAGRLKRLRILNLRSCRHISDQGIEHLAGSSGGAGEHFSMTSNAATCHRPTVTCLYSPSFGNIGTPVLENLVLQDCQKLTDVALKHISLGLRQLRCLNLSFCASITDTGMRYLSKMPSLAELNLRSCDNISDIGIGYLASGGSRIASLDVSFCERVGDESLSHISSGIFHLRTLSLCSCAISDVGIEKLVCASPELQSLGIGQCTRVTDHGLALIAGRLKNLESIDLYGCTKITTVGLECIMKLPKLATLNLGLWHKSQ